MKTDPRVDAYIAKAPAFAQPILTETRQRIERALSDAEETIKWNVPFFLVSGRMVASMAAFKKHVKVGIWDGERPSFQDLVSVAELKPAKEFAAQLREAARAVPLAKSAKQPRVKQAPAKQAPAKKTPAKKTPAKQTQAKQAPAKKTPAKRRTAR